MSIFVNKDTKVIVQGITGGQGRFYALRNRDYGTQVVGGVNPKKAGEDVDGIPVFGSVTEAREATGATVTMILVPAGGAPPARPPRCTQARQTGSRASSTATARATNS